MALSTTVTYVTTTAHSFSSANIGLTSSALSLVNQQPSGVLYHHPFIGSNAAYSDGTIAGTILGDATITGGKLEGSATTVSGYSVVQSGILTNPNTFTIRMTVEPNYSGAGTITTLFFIGDTAANSIWARLDAGVVKILTRDTAGSIDVNATFAGVLTGTVGETRELEFNMDFSNGAIYVMVDGVFNGTTITPADLRNTSPSESINIMSGGNLTTTANDMKCLDFTIFDSIQHTANYSSPSSTLPTTKFETSGSNAIVVSSTPLVSVQSLTITAATQGGSDTFKFALHDGTNDYYHDGTGWTATTSFTVTSANTVAEWNTYASALTAISGGIDAQWRVYAVSDDGSTTPQLTSFTFAYGFYAGSMSAPSECIVYGWLLDANGTAVTNATFEIRPNAVQQIEKNLVARTMASTSTGSDGYFEASIIETSTNSTTVDLVFDMGSKGQIKYKDVVIPNTTTAELTSLV